MKRNTTRYKKQQRGGKCRYSVRYGGRNTRRKNSQSRPSKKTKPTSSAKIRKEACSPYSHNRKINQNSCFTKGVLIDLKNRYNRLHTKEKSKLIHSNDPVEIYRLLREKIPYCSKESCIIQTIAKPETKNQLMALLFAPPQPKEWKEDPEKWLSNFDILNVLQQYEKSFPHFEFLGPSSVDYDTLVKEDNMKCVSKELCKFSLQEHYDSGKRKIGVIFNLDPHHKQGSHWVSLFIDLEDNFMFYFDSTSDGPPNDIRRFMETVQAQGKQMNPPFIFTSSGPTQNIFVNRRMEHQLGNNECGMYSLFFVITMLIREKDGKSLSKEDVIDLFLGKDGRIPDEDMNGLRDDYFRE